VQALYHHPSIEYPIDITIVYMEIMKTQPSAMYHYNGERGALLDSFCSYQESLNPLSEMHANHWDMGLYISG
jgi:a disintegrin and metalloproteinase with thrombospondin motifs 18